MTYNYEKIGKRLKKERTDKGLSQDIFAGKVNEDVVYCDRKKVIDWEKGRKLPSLSVLLYLCEMYDCELGYLLCEYDCKTRPKTDIASITGLTESSIDKISSISHFHDGKIEALNAIIEDQNFEWVLSYISRFQCAIKDYKELVIQKQEDTKIMISEIASNTDNKTSRKSQKKRKETDENLQKANMNVDALEFQIDTIFRKVIDDVKKDTMKKG